MGKIVLDFFSEHLAIPALLVSGLWFYGGYQYLTKEKHVVGLSWQFIGVAVLAAFGSNAVLSGSWYSLVVILVAITVELLLIRRYWVTIMYAMARTRIWRKSRARNQTRENQTINPGDRRNDPPAKSFSPFETSHWPSR